MITCGFFIMFVAAEMTGAFAANSLALLSDSGILEQVLPPIIFLFLTINRHRIIRSWRRDIFMQHLGWESESKRRSFIN